MRKVYSTFVALLLMMVALPAMAQSDEFADKSVALGSAATEIATGQWYVMYNGGRGCYAYENDSKGLYAVTSTDVTISGAAATDVAGYLVQFEAVDGKEDAYYIKTGLNHYWGTLTTGSNNGTEESATSYFVSGKISGYENWFDFMGNNGEMVLDCNAAGGTIAGWGTDLPTSNSSNAAWQILPASLVDASSMITVTINYHLMWNGVEAASYTSTQSGGNPMTVTFDAPSSYLGATCTDETRASETTTEAGKVYDVTYNYVLDQSTLPFVPATIADGAFAKDTKWYYMKPEVTTTYTYYSASLNQNNGGLSCDKKLTADPADSKYFFTFTGNPLQGFQIRPYGDGVTKGAYLNSPDAPGSSSIYVKEDPTYFMLETGLSDGQYRFRYAPYDETGLTYLDAYDDPIDMYGWSYASGWTWYAQNDGPAQFYINEVSEDIVKLVTGGQMEYVSITPEEGTITGGLGEINILFDQPIYRVYGLDHEGAGQEGEDEPYILTLTNAAGETAQSFEYEGDTNGYMINEENPNQLDIYFERPLTENAKYTLSLPLGLVYNEAGQTNAARVLSYSVKDNFNPVTVTGRVYNAAFGDFTGTAWPASINYTTVPYDEALGYFTIQVQVDAKDEVTFKGFTGTSGDDLKVEFSTTDGSISYLDGEEPDSYGSYWKDCAFDGSYSGYYIYFSPSYCNIDFNTEDGVGHGTAKIEGYEYASWTPYDSFIEWYLDDRFASDTQSITVESTTPAEGTVESLQTIAVVFDRELTEVGSGKEITLTSDGGAACGGTITYALNADNKKQIDITLSEAVTADGTYTLEIPSGLGAREAEDNPGYTEAATFTYVIGTGTSATWHKAAIDYIPEGWTGMVYEQGGNFTNITVDWYESSRTLVAHNFMGGDKDLTIKVDENDSILTINGTSEDSYGSMAAYTGNSDYYFCYIYPDYGTYVSTDADNGYIDLSGYFCVDENDNGSWLSYCITWNAETVTGLNTVLAPQTATGIYNLAGQRMGSKVARGIYIKDGRKVVIK